MAPRVLVIDDSHMMAQLITQALTSAGLSADAASNLQELDQQLEAHAFDLVLVDVNMPEMYGDDVIEFLRIQRKISAQLFLYSDIDAEELAAKAKAVGADGYIAKSQGLESAVETIVSAVSITKPAAHVKVLLVGADDAAARQLSDELSAAGHQVLTADSADLATKTILKKKMRPNAVVIDLDTPELDSEALCRFIKGNPLFANIHVILSAAGDASNTTSLLNLVGASAFVTKAKLSSDEILRRVTS
jgi:DNA-binding response OmpR family regulator